MQHRPTRLRLAAFDPWTFPDGIEASGQVQYLRCYLADLCAASVIEEPLYFDRDYLSEFSTFYSTSARGYSNACRRLHVFSLDLPLLRCRFAAALAGDAGALRELNDAYLGFSVVRPIPATPLGRTVLRWYPDTQPARPRVTNPSRLYAVHVAGLKLELRGLAWQQQDTAVGACATVALWSMFHSSALDEHHAIPTTAEITRTASARYPLGRRAFPATDGLTVYQICEAIRAQGLQPAVLDGDVVEKSIGRPPHRFFSRTRFAASCAALIRSGYPVLIATDTHPGVAGHAVCAVGFRPGGALTVPAGAALEEDGGMEHIYLHDNLGPSVRFGVDDIALSAGGPRVVCLRPASPTPLKCRPAGLPDPTQAYGALLPTAIVAALPVEIRMSSDFLHDTAMVLAAKMSKFIADAAQHIGVTLPGVVDGRSFP
jgi:hypothetical protein